MNTRFLLNGWGEKHDIICSFWKIRRSLVFRDYKLRLLLCHVPWSLPHIWHTQSTHSAPQTSKTSVECRSHYGQWAQCRSIKVLEKRPCSATKAAQLRSRCIYRCSVITDFCCLEKKMTVGLQTFTQQITNHSYSRRPKCGNRVGKWSKFSSKSQ